MYSCLGDLEAERPVQSVLSQSGGVIQKVSAPSLADPAAPVAVNCVHEAGPSDHTGVTNSVILIDDLDTLLPADGSRRTLSSVTAQLVALLDNAAARCTWCASILLFRSYTNMRLVSCTR